MKLGLSKKGDPRGRHLVLLHEHNEGGKGIHEVVVNEVLQGAEPVFEFDRITGRGAYRFHMRYLDSLMLVFPHAELSPALDKWYIAQQRAAFKAMPVPDIEVPGFYDYLNEQPAEPFDFQKIGIDEIERMIASLLEEAEELSEILTRLPSYLLNDELGLGKTVQALAVAVRNQWFPMLYVAAGLSGKYSTKRIIDRFFDDDITYQVVEGDRAKRAEQILSGADITITNEATIRVEKNYVKGGPDRGWHYHFDNPEFFFVSRSPLNTRVDYVNNSNKRRRIYKYVVIDEHHRYKTPGAQVTNGMHELLGEKWLFMSGTPILNRIEEIWTILHKIDPERFPTYYQFEKELCIKRNGKIVGYKPDKVIEIKEYLHARSIRRRREHVRDDLPEVVLVRRDITLTAEQRKLYDLIEDEFRLLLEDGTERKLMTYLAQLTRLRQACFSPELYGGSQHSAKIDEMKVDVQQLVESGEKAILFSQWSRACRILEREFTKYNPAYVDGSVKGKKRGDQEDKFNLDDDCRLYIGTIGANKESITLNAATYVLFSDATFVPAEMHQAAGRSAAGGLRGMHLPKGAKVHVIEYVALDTVEEKFLSLRRRKQAVFDRFVERDGGARMPSITMGDIRELLAA